MGGRAYIASEAARGVEELRAARAETLRFAQARAASLSKRTGSNVLEEASSIQDREQLNREQRDVNVKMRASRSGAFSARAPKDESEGRAFRTLRNDRLEIVEKLVRGPQDFAPPSDDPAFEHFEPYSQTRLRERHVSHEELQHHMDCRYRVSPSQLYSLTNSSSSESAWAQGMPLMDGHGEVPLYGDWVLFAVFGEKSGMRYSSAARQMDATKEEETKSPLRKDLGTDSLPADERERQIRKFFSCKLLDLNVDSVQSNMWITGDCKLNMLLFEPKGERDSSAFEKLWKERDGMLLAILNPRIMKPDAKRKSNELTITPRSAESVLVIGRAADYAQCEVRRKDGSRCNACVSKHKGNGVCEYHLEKAIVGQQHGRMEFAAGTSSLIGRPSANYAGERRPQNKHHAPFALHGHSESRYPEAGPFKKFVLESRDPLRPANDPRQPNFDVEARYGRGREERIQRKRKQDELEQHTSNLVTDKSRLNTAPARQAEPAAEYEDADAKFLAEIDKNSVAAKALRTAQDTLERKRAGKGKDKAKRNTGPKQTGALHDASSATQSTASQLLARRTMPGELLPKANLRASKFRSNVLDRNGPAARNTHEAQPQQEAEDDDLLIVD